MAYYVMAGNNSKEYVSLDITKDECFKRISKYTGDGCSLEEIDNFTCHFANEQALRIYLFKKDILPVNLCEKALSIRNMYGGEAGRVMYGFLYEKNKKYLDDPELLISDINYRLLQKDFNFVLDYANHFFRYYDCSDITPEIRYFSDDSIIYGRTNRHFNELDENDDNPVQRMTKQLIYEYDYRDYGRITYYHKIKYRNLHDIIAFLNNYDDKKIKKREEKVKTRTLKKEEQVSFWGEE